MFALFSSNALPPPCPGRLRHLESRTGTALSLLLFLLLAGRSVPAQPPADPGVPTPSASPIQHFRDLLRMSPDERDRALSGKSEDKRRILVLKIAEYQALAPADREQRLQHLELPFYLLPLMRSSPDQRATRLPDVPAPFRELVGRRLEEWDRLTAPQQQEVLNHRGTLQYFLRPLETPAPVLQNTNNLPILPPPLRRKLEDGLSRWRVLSEEDRKELTTQFKSFFAMEESDQQRVLRTIPEPRRREMQGALSILAMLPPDQREQCILGFQKFARLTPAQRQQFILNLQKWQSMTDEEKSLWRRLVSQVRKPPVPGERTGPPVPLGGARIAPLPLATNR